jgi:hypothetical protein
MKKFLVLTLMMLLGMSLMAADVTTSGQVQFEWFQDFGNEYQFNADAELVATAVVDDYNTAKIDIQFDQGGTTGSDAIELDRAYFETALGKFMGTEEMGVDVELTWGFQEYDDESYGQITEWENKDVWEAKFLDWGMGIDVGIMDAVHIEFATAPMPGIYEMMFGAYGGMDPVWVQVYFSRNGNADIADGFVGAAVKVGEVAIMPGMFALTAAVNGAYSLNDEIDASDDDFTTLKYAWGAAIATAIMDMLYLDVGVRGVDDSMLWALDVAAGGSYMDMVGADLGAGFILDTEVADNTFDIADVSVWCMVGDAKLRVGYVYRDKDNPVGNYLALKAPADAIYNPVTSESGVVYLSGTLDF